MEKNVTESIKIAIVTDYITLGQFLKLADIISSGGYAKEFLSKTSLSINGELDNRRGRKLYPGYLIEYQGQTFVITKS